MDRLDIINPSEPTKKLVASATLAITAPAEKHDTITLEQKKTIKDWVSKRVACRSLPADPTLLRQQHPKLFAKAIGHAQGDFVVSKLDPTTLMHLDNRYQCRNTMAAAAAPKNQITAAPDTMGAMMHAMMKCMQGMMASRSSDDFQLVLTNCKPRGAKRSLAASLDQDADVSPGCLEAHATAGKAGRSPRGISTENWTRVCHYSLSLHKLGLHRKLCPNEAQYCQECGKRRRAAYRCAWCKSSLCAYCVWHYRNAAYCWDCYTCVTGCDCLASNC